MYFRTRVQIPAPPPPFFNRISCLWRRSRRLRCARPILPKEFFRIPGTPDASTIFFNETNMFRVSFPSPPLFLHDSPRRPADSWQSRVTARFDANSAALCRGPYDRRAAELHGLAAPEPLTLTSGGITYLSASAGLFSGGSPGAVVIGTGFFGDDGGFLPDHVCFGLRDESRLRHSMQFGSYSKSAFFRHQSLQNSSSTTVLPFNAVSSSGGRKSRAAA